MQVIDLGAWTPYLEQELRAPYFAALLQRVGAARAAGTVYPPEERTFFALTATPPERVRAVILGQDPYHEPGQAMGLAFSVPQGERLPPSLRNIFTELHTDLGLPQPSGGDDAVGGAGRPAAQHGPDRRPRRGEQPRGVGLAALHGCRACRHGRPAAAGGLRPLGLAGAEKRPLLQSAAPRLVLCAPHPSPLSSYRGFFGSRPFSQINAFLQENGEPPIDWPAALTYNMICRKTDH